MAQTPKLLSGANNWTSALRSFSSTRGRSNELEQIDAGTCSLELDNRTRAHDPFSGTASIYSPVALSWVIGATTYPIFTGNVDAWDLAYADPDATATASCSDAFSEFARRTVAKLIPATAQTYQEMIEANEPNGYWSCGTVSNAKVKATTGNDFMANNSADLGASSGSPIVGDPLLEGFGFGLAQVKAGGQIRVASLAASAAENPDGDPGPGSVMTFEFWLYIESSIAAMAPNPTTLLAGPSDSGGTQKWKLEINTSRQLIFTVRMNGGGTSYSCTAAAITTGAWHHIVLATGGNVVGITIDGGAISATNACAGNFAASLSASAGSMMFFNAPNVSNIDLAHIAFYSKDPGSVVGIGSHYSLGLAGHGEQTSADRIASIVTDVYPGYPTSLDAGVRNVLPVYAAGQDGLTLMQDAAACDNVDALLFVKADGTLRYRNANYRSGQAVSATFGDQGGPELPYRYGDGLDLDYSSSFLYNNWSVSKPQGTAQNAQDATSISTYGNRAQSVEAQFVSDANAATVAAALLAKYKDPLARVLKIRPEMSKDANAAAVLALEIGDKIVVKRTPPGGGSRISQTLWIQQITISGAASSPFLSCELVVSPL